MRLKNKRFLITQPMIQGINGSTMVALELAEFLQSMSAKVVVYTYYLNEPAVSLFREKNIKVVGGRDEPLLKLTDFDYIWVHSQVMPLSIVRSLGKVLPGTMPVFIFHHMSAIDWIPDERPYIFDLEQRLSSLSTFVSETTRKLQLKYFTDKTKLSVFQNPAPVYFSQLNYTARETLKNILIVSNHPPKELLEAVKKLEQDGIKTSTLGENGDTHHIITPELISKFDLVITIGKTVQYCLVAGIPVYIYDHWGGKGYLDGRSYKATSSRNFSGRDGTKHDSDYLYKNILEGYKGAVDYHKKNRPRFKQLFSIDIILPLVLNEVEPKRILQFEKEYVVSVQSAQVFAKRQFVNECSLLIEKKKFNKLRKEMKELRVHSKKLEKVKAHYQREAESLASSNSMRLGRSLLWPIRVIKKRSK